MARAQPLEGTDGQAYVERRHIPRGPAVDPNGGSIAAQPEHPYRTRLVIDVGAERACVTREGGKPIDGDEGEQ
ncbi:MAG: hypothetical protein E6J90_04250 [Deltaproteobacteria bacterium]|nr:MAG: hypothetical protein E6J90_04250 [Deltaproteobacteria bacterium]